MTHKDDPPLAADGRTMPAVQTDDPSGAGAGGARTSALRLLSAQAPMRRPSANQYVELKRLIRQQGLLEKQPGYYACRILLNFILLALSLTILIIVDIPWLQIPNAAFLAFVSTQIGFIGHDSGHRQIARVPWINELLSLIHGNLLIGLSAAWWIDKHNQHHSNTNQLDADPDIDIPVLAFSKEQAISKQRVAHFITKYQAFLFLPLLLFEAYHLRFRSIQYVLQKKAKYNLLEALLLAANIGLYIGLLFSLPGLWPAVMFLVVHHGLFGIYMGTVFAPNHKGMVVLDKDSQLDFLRRQVLTSRDLKPHPITTFWYGGQNFQIEHHLFPAMPAKNYKQAQQIVRAFCEERGIPYHVTGVLQSYREIFGYLYQVSAPLH